MIRAHGSPLGTHPETDLFIDLDSVYNLIGHHHGPGHDLSTTDDTSSTADYLVILVMPGGI
jgi:hypothetical protein